MVGRRSIGSVLPGRIPPMLDNDNRDFWTGGSVGELRILRCQECQYYTHPPSPRCGNCGLDRLVPEPVSGEGHVVTYTLNVQAWLPNMEPFLLALVELKEQVGLRVTTNLVDVDAEEVIIDMPVEVVFEEGEGVWFPLFRPARRIG